MEPIIYALLIGINDYPTRPLNGCLNDVKAVETFLDWYQQDASRLNVKKLLNEQATRAEIISGFSHFEAATENDICLLYYSGHGSFAPAPKGFHTATNRDHQSLVCWDSRREGGHDLMDKELGYLIWKYTIGAGKPNLRVVVITDSCNSGTVTRAFTDSQRDRTDTPRTVPMAAEAYHGFTEVVNGQRGYFSQPDPNGIPVFDVQTGPHVHVAAARNEQLAKEDVLDGQSRGLFTHSLLKSLYESKGLISYSELIRRSELKLKRYVTDQNPVLSSRGLPPGAVTASFLWNANPSARPTNWVSFDKKRAWCVDAGALQGVSKGDKVLLENGVSTVVTEVLPEKSVVFEKIGFDINKQYAATILPKPTLRFYVDETVAPPQRILLLAAYQPGLPFELVVNATEKSHFRLQGNGNNVYVTALTDVIPLFKEARIDDAGSAGVFMEQIEQFSRWNQLLALQNPASTLSTADFRVDIFRAAAPPDYTVFNQIEAGSEPIALTYVGEHTPAIRVKVTNTSGRTLWFQPVYMGFNYGIDTQSLNSFSLEPKGETNLTLNVQGKSNDVIKFKVEEEYRQLGYFEILEHLKLIVSTEELAFGVLAAYEQAGLELVPKGYRDDKDKTKGLVTDGLGEKSADFFNDWITTLLSFRIICPTKGAFIEAGGQWESDQTRISTPAGFETKFAWTSSDQINRSVDDITPPNHILGNASLQPFNWLSTRGETASLNVLELYEFTDRTLVSPQQPLIIDFKANLTDAENLVVLARDPDTGLYFSAGTQAGGGTVQIHTLPDGSISERSLFGSVKIFFYKVVLSKVGVAYTYPRLALATLSDALEVSYETDPARIRSTLQGGGIKKIALFTHGIIGDTLDMTKAVALAHTEQGKPIRETTDAVLTFDYENLNTRIQDNARLLKTALAEVGIDEHDDKELTIIAHSMGGLISRWFIEKLKGDEIADRLILCGTPNEGTPLADIRDAFEVLLTFAVNSASFLKPWLFGINLLGKLGSEVSVSFKQMDMVTGIYEELNDGTDPEIPYIIIAGDIRQIGLNLTSEMSLIEKMFTRLGRAAKYDLLDKFVFRASNDIAVGTKSILSIPGTERWAKPPITFTVACDHMNYFVNSESLTVLGRLF